MKTNHKNAHERKRNKSVVTPQQLLELGKLPPQAVELEEAVLGGIMLNTDALSIVMSILKPEAFYKESHQRIYAAICALFQESNPVDILTVTQQLKKSGELDIAGGAFYVTQLTNKVSSGANTEMHARIVLEKYMQRELIRISTETLQRSYEDSTDIFDLLNYAESNLFSISQTNIRKDYEHILPVLGRAMQQIELAADQKFGGVPSGFTSLDRITGGFQNSDLIILAARPGTGKTALIGTIARNAAVDHKKPVAIFSLEMTSIQLMTRLISAEAEVPSDKLRKGELNALDFENINNRIGALASSQIYIDDTPSLTLFEFRAKSRRLKSQHDVKLIIVDYLQLMVADNESKSSREQEVALISRTLKAVAKELDVPIIALSQMSRAVEQRTGSKRPQLSDLRESGAIEQDADVVMFIYRPDMMGLDQDDMGNQITEGMSEIIIAKHRNGRTDSANLMFVSQFTKFVEPGGFSGAFSSSSGEPAPQKVQPNTDFLNQGPTPTSSEERDSDFL